MALIQALFLVPVAVLSPGLSLIFAIAISGRWLLAQPSRQRWFFPAFCAGILAVWLARSLIPGAPDNLQMALAFVSGGVSALVFFAVFTRTWKTSLALVTVTYLNALHAFLLPIWWKADYSAYIGALTKSFDGAYQEAVGTGTAQAGMDQFHAAVIYILQNLQPAMWTLGSTLSAYIGMLFLVRALPVRWRLDRIRIPFHVVYPLLIGMALLLIPATRASGTNLLLMLSGLFLIQGISVLHYFWKSLLKGAPLLTIILIVAIAFNPFFIVLIALAGVVDTWFNLRKLENEEEIDESDPGERYA